MLTTQLSLTQQMVQCAHRQEDLPRAQRIDRTAELVAAGADPFGMVSRDLVASWAPLGARWEDASACSAAAIAAYFRDYSLMGGVSLAWPDLARAALVMQDGTTRTILDLLALAGGQRDVATLIDGARSVTTRSAADFDAVLGGALTTVHRVACSRTQRSSGRHCLPVTSPLSACLATLVAMGASVDKAYWENEQHHFQDGRNRVSLAVMVAAILPDGDAARALETLARDGMAIIGPARSRQSTPLHVAAAANRPATALTLLLNGANPVKKDSHGKTALDRARRWPDTHAVIQAFHAKQAISALLNRRGATAVVSPSPL